VSSISGLDGDPGQSAYAASKAAIANLTKSINKEMSGFGIVANCVSPGFIETSMTEEVTPEYRDLVVSGTLLKRQGKPSEVASLITYLALEAPSYLINQDISISGGL
jgi:NAD(P)-dependent dehydrogenase (short-subunit alcohol dehydrogenase family)